MTTVHASSEYRMVVKLPAPPDYPQQAAADPYTAVPANADYATRRREFLAHWANNPAPNNTKMAYCELARMAAGHTPHEGIFYAACDFIDARKDCSDFVIHALLRLQYQFADGGVQVADERSRYPTEALLKRTRHALLSFKYWPDEPGIDSLCTWTENHHILFASAAYLAGQLFPDTIFKNSGQSGRDKMMHNRPRIIRWLDLRFRTGFSEWLSHVYYDEDLTALLSLVDFCHDAEIRERAAMVIDMLLLDMALNSYRGVFGSSHGRSYENTKKWAAHEATIDVQKLLFGMGQYSGFDSMSAVNFALSRYRMPPVIGAIARDLRLTEMENRQRMGIRVSEAARWGLRPDNFEDGMVFLTLEAYIHPRTINLTMRMFDAFDWWQNDFFAPFRPYRRLLKVLRRLRLLPLLARALEWDLCRNTREEVNLMTYRTPDYMLSCAQDYRAGYGGDQQHVWQATLGANAICFTTHPAAPAGDSPNYWTGSGQLPRAAQVKNVVIAIYNLHRKPALYVPTRLFYTHAWLPRDQFDEVIEQSGWIFARKGDGYLALRSQRPYLWNSPRTESAHDSADSDTSAPVARPQAVPLRLDVEDIDREVIAPGKSNIWICELGRKAVDGSFADFAARICRARLRFAGVNVVYNSPAQGRLEFGWTRPLTQNGSVVPLHDYPRYDNPYTTAVFPAEQLTVKANRYELKLNWETGQREFSVL